MKKLTDNYGRNINYIRLSLTDRCDLRCFYCMAEQMVFLPKKDLLSLEELAQICDAFITRGVRKIRLTGGEPLVRKGFLVLVERLSKHLQAGRIDEIALTTNATQLQRFAKPLKKLGVKRINVSLDSLEADNFKKITRGGDLAQVLSGIHSALEAGIKVKINTVALKNDNASEIKNIIEWAHGLGMDISLIEVMPMGDTGYDRIEQYIPLSEIKSALDQFWTLENIDYNTGGPSRYVKIGETGGRLGFISPLSHNFCESCNRVRITCTGKIYMCLGHGAYIDLRAALRSGVAGALDEALDKAMLAKPQRHEFEIKTNKKPELKRHMSVTGG